MTDPAIEDGGGHVAAPALAFTLIAQDSVDPDMGHRFRQALRGDTDSIAALKLGLSATAVRRACRSGRPSARIMRLVCLIYRINGHWLLTGQGPMSSDGQDAADVPSEHLIQELSRRLETMIRSLESARHTTQNDASPESTPPDGHWL